MLIVMHAIGYTVRRRPSELAAEAEEERERTISHCHVKQAGIADGGVRPSASVRPASRFHRLKVAVRRGNRRDRCRRRPCDARVAREADVKVSILCHRRELAPPSDLLPPLRAPTDRMAKIHQVNCMQTRSSDFLAVRIRKQETNYGIPLESTSPHMYVQFTRWMFAT